MTRNKNMMHAKKTGSPRLNINIASYNPSIGIQEIERDKVFKICEKIRYIRSPLRGKRVMKILERIIEILNVRLDSREIFIYMEINGHPLIPLAQNNFPLWQFPSNFSMVFWVPNSWGCFEALNDILW